MEDVTLIHDTIRHSVDGSKFQGFFTHSIHLKLNTLGVRREELMHEVSLTAKVAS
jgi:hypothetical protein